MRRPRPTSSVLRLLTGRLGLVVIGVLVLAAMGGAALLELGGEPDGGRDEPLPPTAQSEPGALFTAKALGVAGIRPPGWRLERGARVLRLRSPGRTGIVAVSTAPRSVTKNRLMDSTLAALTRSYRRPKLSSRRSAALGGRSGVAVSGAVTNSRGLRLDFLVATAKGRRHTYLVQVFVARDPAGVRLRQAQSLVDSLEISG